MPFFIRVSSRFAETILRALTSGMIWILLAAMTWACGANIQPAAAPTPTAESLTSVPAPTPSPIPEPTAQPSPTPAATAPDPTPTSTAPIPTPILPSANYGKEASDYTESEIMQAAENLTLQFWEAVTTDPTPDMERAKATYSEACQPNDEEFEEQVNLIIETFQGRQFSVEVIGASRLPERDDAAIVLAFPLLNGERISQASRSLLVFENGRWLDSDCDEGRALFLSSDPDESDAAAESYEAGDLYVETPSLDTPTTFSDNPARHSDEEIARSFEWVANGVWAGALADAGPDLERIRSVNVFDCQTGTDEELTQVANTLRQQIGDVADIRIEVLGVERVDQRRAWIVAAAGYFGILEDPSPPTLALFEEGHWRDADCLVDSAPDLDRPVEIEYDQRVSYIGEPVRLHWDWEEEPYELTVMDVPEKVDDYTVRLHIRITAVTATLELGYLTVTGWLSTRTDDAGDRIEWPGDICDQTELEGLTLAGGEARDSYLCFRADDQDKTVPSRPFALFESYYEDSVRRIDLTADVRE